MEFTTKQLRAAMIKAGLPVQYRDHVVSALREARLSLLPSETNEQRRELYRLMYATARESIEMMEPGRSFYRPAWAIRMGLSRNASLHAVRQACADGLLAYTGHQYVRQRLPTDAR